MTSEFLEMHISNISKERGCVCVCFEGGVCCLVNLFGIMAPKSWWWRFLRIRYNRYTASASSVTVGCAILRCGSQ
jgi:hypothetical protein